MSDQDTTLGARIIVVGTSGSGKTTLAKQLAACLARPHIELDSINWQADWTMAADFVEQVDAVTDQAEWVMDGNYSRAREVSWPKADMLVWLDYSLPITLWRISKRTMRRLLFREELWNGNRERFRTQFFSRDSIFLWVWTSHKRRKRDYGRFIEEAQFPHLTWVRLQSPSATAVWLQSVRQQQGNRPEIEIDRDQIFGRNKSLALLEYGQHEHRDPN